HQAGDAEVARLLDRLEPRLLVAGLLQPAASHPGAVAAPEHFGELLEAEPVTDAAARPSDLAAVLFTSGSSGEPKGVLHTHRALAYKARLMAAVHGLTGADAVLMPAPLAHVSGLLNGVLLPGVVPMKTVLMERWGALEALEVIAREHITFMIGPPTFFVSLMAAPGFDAEAVASLRLVSCGGAGVTPAFVETAATRLGCRVKRTYGSTEAPTVTTSAAGDDPERGRVTDGRPTGEVELRIAPDGELQVRGPELFVGYADPEHNGAAAFARGGWFRTGDRATIDGEGWLTVLGRIADVIIRGGENIAAAEVEGALEAHPSVRQAMAVGYPDERLGERVCAFVVATAPFDVEECRRWFEQRGLARYKTPERVVQVDALPVMAAGKPDRAELARRADEDRGAIHRRDP
ncbi:MAG: AMP-binding protein, partial [Actinobacteria bacterium]|nr:AMP-binding protein [Actinomycetota bacterium]